MTGLFYMLRHGPNDSRKSAVLPFTRGTAVEHPRRKMDDAASALALAYARGVGPRTFARLIERFDSPRAVLAASRADLLDGGVLSARVADAVLLCRGKLQAARGVIAHLERTGVRPLSSGDPRYPSALRQLIDPPPLLFVQGDPGLCEPGGIAMVGTTNPSPRGAAIAGELAARLAATGSTIVSGYARGVDTAAHLGALRAGGRTILVIPTGVFAFQWRPLFRRFAGLDGRTLILSERHPSEGWTAGNAIARNRLIVALSRAVLFVETLARPAAQETFGLARRLGKPVFVVKYRRAPASAAGNATLLRLGAVPITSYADVPAIAESRPLPPPDQRQFGW